MASALSPDDLGPAFKLAFMPACGHLSSPNAQSGHLSSGTKTMPTRPSPTLALHGGRPVRTRPLARHCIGANLIGKEEKRLVGQVIDSHSLFRHCAGKCLHMVEIFEAEFREFLGTRYALAVSSGSGALFCAMRGLNIGKGDEVIIPSFGWITDYNVVELAGAKPVFADIDDSLNLSPEGFAARITPRTKAVIVIYYQGAASRVDEIVRIARRHNIKVIEDVAQAVGGTYRGRKLGTLGDVSIFSLQHNKVITAGDGGLLATHDPEVFERAVRCHDLGMLRPVFKKQLPAEPVTEACPGFQWRMNELTGAVALAQLRKLPGILKAVKTRSDRLRATLLKEFPRLKLRKVRPADDIGIVIEMDLGSEANAKRFREAYEAEGLIFGATSGCGTMSRFDPVAATLKRKHAFREKDFAKSKEIEGRMAGIAVLPVYSARDMRDIAQGVVKVLKGLDLVP
jgi:8-amino-3,8-dideoxy-alpha-D-manno-octulosonate transaminase